MDEMLWFVMLVAWYLMGMTHGLMLAEKWSHG